MSPIAEQRAQQGVDFEAATVASLAALHPDAVIISCPDRAERELLTKAAMLNGARLIIGGRLPTDNSDRRVGEPDLLISDPAAAGYRPVDIKHHRSLDAVRGGLPACCATLGAPSLREAVVDPERSARKHRGDLLQLAHYQRMLEAAGHATAGGRRAGIIGVDGVVVWYDLDEAIWSTPSTSAKSKMRSTMDIYDFEFDFRLDIMAVARLHMNDPAVDPLVVPVRIGECPDCPWWAHCQPQLEAGSGDVSLLPRTGWRAWRVHRDHGVTNRAELANLDHRTAYLVANKVDLRPIMAALGNERVLKTGKAATRCLCRRSTLSTSR